MFRVSNPTRNGSQWIPLPPLSIKRKNESLARYNTNSSKMLLLFETPAGYSLFKVKDEDKLKDIDVRLSLFVLLLLLLLLLRR